VETVDALVTVTGTTFAVTGNVDHTCICVLEGKVEVEGKGAGHRVVPGGQQLFVYGDGVTPSRLEPLTEAQSLRLLEIRRQGTPPS
jgi:ferric-dicitrate binding protein FerR (iron transport regulator)